MVAWLHAHGGPRHGAQRGYAGNVRPDQGDADRQDRRWLGMVFFFYSSPRYGVFLLLFFPNVVRFKCDFQRQMGCFVGTLLWGAVVKMGQWKSHMKSEDVWVPSLERGPGGQATLYLRKYRVGSVLYQIAYEFAQVVVNTGCAC